MKNRKFFVLVRPLCLKKTGLLCLYLLLATAFGVARSENRRMSGEAVQQSGIVGHVFDAAGEPLPGVNVVVKGSLIGTVTDLDGRFVLEVSTGTELEVSCIGFTTQTVKATNNMRIVLQENSQNLEEVVVVGYGTVKKSDLTGAVSSMTAKSFLDQPASSVNSVLSGRAPGVTVRRSNGAPGQGPIIRIRGANSLLGDNNPLIVVDGNYGEMPNMYDIESIEILKDASATAIYGSRGANGVILVTTKRGTQETKPTLKVYSDVSFDQVTQRYDLMEAYEFAEFNSSIGAWPFTDDELAGFKGSRGTDWQDLIFRTGLSQNYKAVFSGGGRDVKYYVSPSYDKATGIVQNTEAGSYGLTAKVDMNLSSRISVQLESNISHGNSLNPELAQGDSKTSIPLMAAATWAPTEPVYEETGEFHRLGIGVGTCINPVLMTTVQKTKYRTGGNGVGNIKIKLIDGLVFDAKGFVFLETGGDRDFESKNYHGVTASAHQYSFERTTWLVNAYLTYVKTFARDHNLSVMAGFEETKSASQNFSATARELPIESVGWYNLGLAAPNIGVSSGYDNSALRSFFGRVNYNYAARYYLTANYRADGSSKFKGDNQFGYFPSFSLAWRLSEEGFLKDSELFQNLKLRGGWGVTGSQTIDTYATYTTLSDKNFSWGDVSHPGYRAQVGGNPNLKWESTRQFDLGLDLTMLNNRLSISADYYSKKTEDLLAPVSVPSYNGGGTVTSNVGSVENKGFEANINFVVVENRDYAYEVNLNGAINRNKVLDIGDQELIYGRTYASGLASSSPFVLMPGEAVGTIYGLKYLGIWQENEAANAAAFQQEPGDYKYEDLDGDHNYGPGDYQVIGNTNPDFTWGFNHHFSYKNVDFNMLLEGVHGRDVMNWAYMVTTHRIDFSQLITHR
ncbi:MAG: TonB-dependent receptor, partial [Tannerellaceae bacterium]|nr:TonB-dependent receptor [Tannerellaceae bacterium]